MVDSVGIKTGSVSERPVTLVSRVPVTPAVSSLATSSDSIPVTTVASTLSAKPPVDADRVRQIKTAVANGTFPITPARIADRLIALRYEWLSDDKA